jgi:hypothetical protein
MENETIIVKEWRMPKPKARFVRTDKSNPLFYVTLLQKGRTRYLKIGTAENGIGTRFSQQDYKKYSSKKILYVAELQSTKKNKKNECYHIETLTRGALFEISGLKYIPNDRFTYFKLPDEIPILTSTTSKIMIPLR